MQAEAEALSLPDSVILHALWDDVVRARLTRNEQWWISEAMDAEDLAMQRYLHVLSRSNKYSPIHRLPPEIIARIFAICAKETHAVWRWQDWSDIGWIATTHVCQRWRQIALSITGLWTTVTFKLGDRWAEEMYTRSRAASVNVLLHSRIPLEKYELVAKHISRTRELTLGPLQFYPSFFLLSEDYPAPLLETLYIDDPNICNEDSDATPLNYLGTCAPALRTLKIRTSCPDIPWNASLLAQLVSLEMACHPPDCSINDVLTTLQRMGQLESLHLTHTLPDFTPSDITVHRPVFMPCLKYLEVEDAMPFVPLFLQALRAPVCVKLRLTLTMEYQHELETRASFALVAAWVEAGCWSATPALRLTTFYHEITGGWYLRVKAFQRVDDAPYVLRDKKTNEEGDICILLQWDDSAAFMETDVRLNDLVCMCYDTFASAELQHLVIDVEHWHVSDWRKIAGTLADLQVLRIAGDTAGSFLSTFRQALNSGSHDQDPEDEKWLLPRLMSLELGGLELCGLELKSNMFGDVLYDWLRARVDAGCPLGDLTLRDCFAEPAQLEKLRTVPGLVLYLYEEPFGRPFRGRMIA
ncbi:hypothetical protein FA95DRAFT_1549468 [Auriscalpium vulgare]|uniref:Uncharacterized protein n=1 Tax=Auriscalpium vulgare TaxID=40419 RepID=A0ACB8R9H1_9AGAM|nr:hypothetical protein FA95DRAFT_1549468 [Auriscalpium vulgare]